MKVQILKKESIKSFSYLAGINRPINPSHVTTLANSINKIGCIRAVIVAKISFLTGKSVDYIIDGQHLFNALIRNNMDIPYVMIEIKTQKELIEKIALLNASSKSWKMIDYITSWSSINSDYIKLNHYFNVYDLELVELSSILSNSTQNEQRWGEPTKILKRGEFKIVNEEQQVKMLDYITDVLKIVPRTSRQQNRYIVSGFINLYKNNIQIYNHSKFLTNLEKNKSKFVLSTQEPEKLSQMLQKLIS